MCGIVGYVGDSPAAPLLLESLRRLEYRGYDSAGLAVITPSGQLSVHRAAGKLQVLRSSLDGREPEGSTGIGHTRWATHGRPSDNNAHPHTDCGGRLAVVHNGIIENYEPLRKDLEAKGHRFRSDTDTEVLAHLIEVEMDSSHGVEPSGSPLLDGVRGALRQVRGAYAIAVIDAGEPWTVVGARRHASLVAGISPEGTYLASDIPAILHRTRDILRLQEGEIVRIGPKSITVYDDSGREQNRRPTRIQWDESTAEKGGYTHFVLKEIMEQPEALANALRGRAFRGQPVLPEMRGIELDKIERVVLAACGSSYYACMIARYAIERWARIPVEVSIASEFRYGAPVLGKHVLFVGVSQSGETADTLAGFHLAQEAGCPTVAITNVMDSAITHGAGAVLYLQVGPEIGVVATKTFTGQLAVLYLLALHLAAARGALSQEEAALTLEALRKMPQLFARYLEGEVEGIEPIAARCAQVNHLLFIGRGVGYPTALEGALKLKEISYIHAEGYPAGELKHGPIALLEPGMPLLAVATMSQTYDKVMSNIQEARARGARIIAIATEGDTAIRDKAEDIIYVPEAPELLSPMVNVVPMQLFAYRAAVARGCDVDQPRNLAKTVTVE